MRALNVHETKTQLSALLADVEEHDAHFVICRSGKPVAELVPHRHRNRLEKDPFLSRIKIKCDLTKPLTDDEWEGR